MQQSTVGAMSNLLDAAPDAMVCVQGTGQIRLVNGQAENLFGYAGEELTGQHIEVLLPEAVLHLDLAGRDAAATIPCSPSPGMPVELPARRKDGATFPAEISWSAVDGLVLIAVRDSTERKQAAVTASRLAAIVQAAPLAIIGQTTEMFVTSWNPAAGKLYGYTEEEMIGRHISVLFPPADREREIDELSRVSRGVPVAGYHTRRMRKDGTQVTISLTLSPVTDGTGKITGICSIARDLAEQERLMAQAERARMERQLAQSRRMESLGQLAGGVAHDFNNMLSVITGWASMLCLEVEEIAGPTPAAEFVPVREQLDRIVQTADRAAVLTRQLLTFARREVNQPQVLDLNELVASARQLLRPALGDHIQLSCELASDIGPVLVDPGQMEQVLINLAVNARDAMPAGGQVSITTGNLIIGNDDAEGLWGLPRGRYVSLKVRDNGAGIPEEAIDRVVEPFFTTKPAGTGAGLGLATAYGIISQARGDLKIYSEPGIGTSVTVLLPVYLHAPGPGPGADTAPSHRAGAGQTVLLVEDSADLRQVTEHMLTRNGYRVLRAVDGPEALEILDQHDGPIDLLLTDVVMPHMSGKALADLVVRTHPEIRVLFMSGYTQGLLSSQGVLESGVHLLEKPFDPSTLLLKLDHLLGVPVG